jgi:ubiquinone/menaquinone biosynthesis C-methylase UbiE
MERAQGLSELLDGPLDEALLAGNLRDLARVNRWLGGSELSWRALEHVHRSMAGGRELTMLDVGTGGADIPLALLERAGRKGLRLHIEATDVRPEIVASARRSTAGVDQIRVSLVDEPHAWPEKSVDVAHASLVLHHLEPAQAVQLLARMGRAARTAVIVNDLVRRRRWWLAAWLLTRFATGNRYTRHDAPISVRRAYQAVEVVQMAARAGLREEARFLDALGHRYAVVLRPPAA